jgi:hypothetical protein
LSDAEFWGMTPRAFYALVERHRLARRHELYCAAVTASAVYNVNRREGAPPIRPEAMIGEESKAQPERQSSEDMLMIVRHVLNPMFNGTEGEKAATS